MERNSPIIVKDNRQFEYTFTYKLYIVRVADKPLPPTRKSPDDHLGAVDA